MKLKMLSKSRYLNGLQCPRLLWIAINEPKRIPEPDTATLYIFDQGHLVGELAKKLFPGGIDIPADNFIGNVEITRKMLVERKTLFEAGILTDRIYSRIDILSPAANDKWDIIEVKSSTSVKDINIHDVAFQRYCCELQGISVNRCYLAFINNKYTRDGEIDPKELFSIEDITDQVEGFGKNIQDRIDDMLKVISSNKCPEIGIGTYCRDPYECPVAECWDFLPEDNIFNLYWGGKKCFDLYDSGIMTIKDIPAGYKLNQKQHIQQACEINGQPHIDKTAITGFLSTLRYPLYYLDFETMGLAVPLFNGTRPYQAVPFQFSLHVVNNEHAEVEHFSFLARGTSDPRPVFLSELKKVLGYCGSIIVYNQGFEEGSLKELAKVFPEYKDWVNDIRGRLIDLLQPFRNFSYYHPGQKGSASIKKIMPVLTGRGYESMGISDGNSASIAFYTVTYLETTEDERNKVRADLKEYCGQDTEGMIWIVEKLKEISV